MRNHCFRVISFIISLFFLMNLPECSKAAVRDTSGQVCGEHLKWMLDDEGLLTISGTGEMYSYAEQNTPWNSLAVKAAVIEDGVTGIGPKAFRDCYSMKSIIIPESVTSIGDYAFFKC